MGHWYRNRQHKRWWQVGAGAVMPSGRWCVGLASRNGSTERVGTWLWWNSGCDMKRYVVDCGSSSGTMKRSLFHVKLAHNVEELPLEVVLKVMHHFGGIKRRDWWMLVVGVGGWWFGSRRGALWKWRWLCRWKGWLKRMCVRSSLVGKLLVEQGVLLLK